MVQQIHSALLAVCAALLGCAALGAEAEGDSGSERFEVSSIKAVRPILADTVAALRQNDLARAREAFDPFDSAWNGIEVYVNVRSKPLYEALELDLEAKITKELARPGPDVASLLSDAQTMLAKYDELINLVVSGPPLNPLYDDVARLRIVRSHLRDVNPALKAGNLAKARKAFEAFDDMWFDIEDFVRAQSLDAYVIIERGMLQIEAALMPDNPDVAKVTALVNTIMNQYNTVVAQVQRQARRSP